MARTSITIILELDQALDETVTSPAGSARLPDGPGRRFMGWLGLAEAIDTLARTPLGVLPTDTSQARETP